ncbi:MAG: hypothetical protein SNJ69_15805 [Chloroflexaceae bacterium]
MKALLQLVEAYTITSLNDAVRELERQFPEVLARDSGRDPLTITSARPPFGHLTRALARRLLARGYQPVICSIMPVHWLLPAALSVRQVVRQAEGGSLIVLHETPGGPPVAHLTDQILTRLAGRGFSYVTVDTLRAGRAATGSAPNYIR